MKSNELLEKIKKLSTIKESAVLSESEFLRDVDETPTDIPALNIALSGDLLGGLKSGLTTLAGESKNFKTMYSLVMAAAYQKKNKDSVVLLYDSEFGAPLSYFESVGIDPNRVLHTPIKNIEDLKFDLMNQLENLKRGDKVFILVDSIGNLASKKEVQDAIDAKSVADMSRAKAFKSLYRIITPYLKTLDIPMVQIAHIYMTQEMFSKAVVSGGCVIAGTKIIMSDGLTKCIEDVKPGDFVQTCDGSREVEISWTPETLGDPESECVRIEFEDGNSVTCSKEHKFLVNGRWIEAKSLVEGVEVETI